MPCLQGHAPCLIRQLPGNAAHHIRPHVTPGALGTGIALVSLVALLTLRALDSRNGHNASVTGPHKQLGILSRGVYLHPVALRHGAAAHIDLAVPQKGLSLAAAEAHRQYHAVRNLLQTQVRLPHCLQDLVVQAGHRVFRRAPGAPNALTNGNARRSRGLQISAVHTHLQLPGICKHRHGARISPEEYILIGALRLEPGRFQVLHRPSRLKSKHGSKISTSADIHRCIPLGCHAVLHRNMNFRHILSPSWACALTDAAGFFQGSIFFSTLLI